MKILLYIFNKYMFPNKLINNVLIKQLIKPMYNKMTAGESLVTLQNKITELNKLNIYTIVDYIKESSNKNEIIQSVNEYKNIANINNAEAVAIKLSSFDFQYYHINKVVNYLVEKNKKVLIDAEEVQIQNKINDLTNMLIETFNTDSVNVYKTYQMYRKDSLKLLEKDLQYYPYLGLKLVRGAYYNTDEHSGILFKTKEETDKAFEEGIKMVFPKINNIQGNKKMFICTHNKKDIDTMIEKFKENEELYKHRVFHGSLYGFINNETDTIIASGIKTFKYLPYGKIEDSVPYLVRRLYEKYSFVAF